MQYNWKFFACLFGVLVLGIIVAGMATDFIQEKKLDRLLSDIPSATPTSGAEANPSEVKMY